MNSSIIGIREHPLFLQRAIDYFSTRWSIDKKIYDDCIRHSIDSKSPLPRWYLMLDGDEIIGGYGLITNDFISRQDLYPWLCALFIEEKYRGKAWGSILLEHGVKEAAKIGYNKVYLCTEHIGYYEKYGWSYIGNGIHPWGEESRIYEHDAIS